MENNKLELAAERFDLSVEEMAIILNLDNWTESDVTASTIANVYNKIPMDSEAQSVALKKWGELCDSFSVVDYFFKIVRPNGKTREFVLVKKNELALQVVENASTLDETISAHNKSPIDSEAKAVALIKWNAFALQVVENASTLDEVIFAYQHSPYEMELLCENDVRDIATKKGIDFCTTVQEIKKLFYSNPYYSSYPENMQIKWILEKWNELLLLEIERTSTIKEVKDIMGNIPSSCPFDEILCPAIGRAHKRWGELCIAYQELRQYITDCSPYSDEEISAIKRLIPLCTEVDQIKELWYYREKTQDLAFQKWDELSLLEIEKASTLSEIYTAQITAPDGGMAKIAAMKKYLELS